MKASLGVDPNAAGILNKLSEEVRALLSTGCSYYCSVLCIYIHLNLIDWEEATNKWDFLTENSGRWKNLP